MYLIGNGRVLTFDSELPYIDNGGVVTNGESIVAVDGTDYLRENYPDAEFVDADGGVIMPGLIDAHTHFYRHIARGLSLPKYRPSDHYEIISGKWWRIDSKLTLALCKISAYAAMIDGIHNGVTTFLNLHSSYLQPSGSLMTITSAVRSFGVRVCLGYETSDRCGREKCDSAITENFDFHEYISALNSNRIASIIGLHSPSTLTDRAFNRCVSRNKERIGYHIHVSEGPYDALDSLRRFGVRPLRRLYDLGILGEDTLLVHCTDVNDEDLRLIRDSGSRVITCPESNMLNAVGSTPIKRMLDEGITVGIGSDAYSSDMLEAVWLAGALQRHEHGMAEIDPAALALALLNGNRSIASRIFKTELGILKPGAAADIIVIKHIGTTPFSDENAAEHILCGMRGSRCIHSMAAGRLLMKDGKLLMIDEKELSEEIRKLALNFWSSFD